MTSNRIIINCDCTIHNGLAADVSAITFNSAVKVSPKTGKVSEASRKRVTHNLVHMSTTALGRMGGVAVPVN